MKTYTAAANREGRWWIIDVADVGATQARNLSEAREMAMDLISVATETPVADINVELRISLASDLEQEIAQAKEAIRDLEERQQNVARTSRTVVRKLTKSVGLTGKDAAVVLGISPQRVSQLLAD